MQPKFDQGIMKTLGECSAIQGFLQFAGRRIGEHEPGEENRVGKNAKNGMSKQRQSFDLLFDIIVAGRCRAEKLCDTA